MYLEAGKHVLCEKAFALDAAQARRMVAAADAAGVFLMEAIWSRFLPSYRALVEVLASGRIGTPLQVDADFGFRVPVDPATACSTSTRGAGPCSTSASTRSSSACSCSARSSTSPRPGSSGPRVSTSRSPRSCAIDARRARCGEGGDPAPLACTARISGTDGWIDLPAFMHCPTEFTVNVAGAGPEIVDGTFDGDGLQFEIAEVHRCIADGLTESPTMPLSETLRPGGGDGRHPVQIGLATPERTDATRGRRWIGRRGRKMSLPMEITFVRLDDRGDDRAELVEFLTAHEFPFHATRRPARAAVEALIDDGHFGDANHVAYWIHTDAGRIGLVVLKDLTDDAPLFDLRLATEHREGLRS